MPTYDCRHDEDAQVTCWYCSRCGGVRHGCKHVCERAKGRVLDHPAPVAQTPQTPTPTVADE